LTCIGIQGVALRIANTASIASISPWLCDNRRML
jgi:hypothetical protein